MASWKGLELFTFFAREPEKADLEVFGRVAEDNRRGFLRGAGLATMSAMLGVETIPFACYMPAGFIPVAIADKVLSTDSKDGLVVLGDRPLNAETPAHLLDDDVTPTSRYYIRSHGTVPEGDAATWKVSIDGEVDNPLILTIANLKKDFEIVTAQLTIECGGNGRMFFNPPVKGNQWTVGAVGCARWTGVRLADVLKASKVKPTATYTAHYGADQALDNQDKAPLSRGIPLWKAMNPYTLIAFSMNDGQIHQQNGYPLRLVVPGWVGSASHKWLTKITLRDTIHDGPGMSGKSYRMPSRTLEPGEDVSETIFTRIIQEMPVKSLITNPKSKSGGFVGRSIQVRGHAWAGESMVTAVEISIDFGATWTVTSLTKPINPYAWQHWKVELAFPEKGYYEIWSRATDDVGRSQPFSMAWNPNGYLNNAIHRIAIRVT